MITLRQIRERLNRDPTSFEFTAKDRADLDVHLDRITEAIHDCHDFTSADAWLDALGDAQTTLATILFKCDAKLSEKQKTLVRRFDRCDDPELRLHAFFAIKNGTFL